MQLKRKPKRKLNHERKDIYIINARHVCRVGNPANNRTLGRYALAGDYTMTYPEIYENLCHYDTRHPLYSDLIECCYLPDEEPRKPRQSDCACDSCHRGTDKLAVELLKMKDIFFESAHSV